MKRAFLLLVLIAVMAVAFSCKKSADNETFHFKKGRIEVIDSLYIQDRNLIFYCTILVNYSNVWEYDSPEIEYLDKEYYIAAILKGKNESFRLPMLDTIQCVIPVEMDDWGTCTFHFYQTDTTTIDTTITIL
ncbi:MAG: hypothetical protein GF307_15110 [candidate division Zixibacteria bacterium]|nr:hypothetical protein [candidate division Zixibacteria bacterium]